MTLYAGHIEVTYEGNCDLYQLYNLLHRWVIENDYVESTDDEDFPENLYYQSAGRNGSEVLLLWRCVYVPEGNPFYRRILRIMLHATNMRDVDVVRANKKVTLQNARFNVIMDAFLESDYEEKWRNHWLLKHFYHQFVYRIIWRDFEVHREEVLGDAYSLQKELRKFFDTYHPDDRSKSFTSPLGIKEEK